MNLGFKSFKKAPASNSRCHIFGPRVSGAKKKGSAIEVYLCLLFVSPLNKASQRELSMIWLFCGENDPACRNTDSRLFSAINDTKLTSFFVSSDCFCFHLKKILIFFCGIPSVGFLIPFAFIQMGSLILFLTFNLQTGGLC